MRHFLSAFLVFILFLFLFPKFAFAFPQPKSIEQIPSRLSVNDSSVTITLAWDTPVLDPSQNYFFAFWRPGSNFNIRNYSSLKKKPPAKDGKSISGTLNNGITSSFDATGDWRYKVWGGNLTDLDKTSSLIYEGYFYMFRCEGTKGDLDCPAITMDAKTFQPNSQPNLYIEHAKANQVYTIWFDKEHGILVSAKPSAIDATGKGIIKIPNIGGPSENPKTICMTPSGVIGGINFSLGLSCDFKISGIMINMDAPLTPVPTTTPIQSGEAGLPPSTPPTPTFPFPSPPCNIETAPNGTQTCKSVNTALGVIETDPILLIKSLFGILLSLSGGIALILIIVSGYSFIASQGNPEKVQGARDTLTSAIVGLLFIIFSMVILQIVGVDILHIPGIGK